MEYKINLAIKDVEDAMQSMQYIAWICRTVIGGASMFILLIFLSS
jgi:hypothetical protein